MDRRTFLRSATVAAGALSAGGLLAACSRGSGGIPDGTPSLSVIVASFETLTGPARTVPFGLRTMQNEEIPDADLSVYLRDLGTAEVVAGPLETTYTEGMGTGFGLYQVTLGLEEPGNYEIVAVRGDEFGSAALKVVTPEESQVAAPGDQAVSVETPTPAADLGYEKLCTQDPPCGMHEISLADALAQGRPTVLLFATPAYCQTAVCGPAVGTVDEVRTGGDWGDTAWIHVEIYSDAGQTLGEPVQSWELPTEPWLFTVGGDGVIADRLDGPMLPETIEGMASALQA